jgi:hypothetical protein
MAWNIRTSQTYLESLIKVYMQTMKQGQSCTNVSIRKCIRLCNLHTDYILTLSASTMAQYLLLLLMRSPLPNFIISRNTDEAANPMKAAERKQF